MARSETSWLDYAMLSMFVLNVIGALSVAAGMWMILKWLMKDQTSPMVESQGRAAQTDESEHPHIVYKLYETNDQLHDQKDSLERRLQGQEELSVAMENDLRFERQQNAILSSSVREHECRWVANLERMITVHPCGDVYHSSPNCRWLRGGRTLSLCAFCRRNPREQEGSVTIPSEYVVDG